MMIENCDYRPSLSHRVPVAYAKCASQLACEIRSSRLFSMDTQEVISIRSPVSIRSMMGVSPSPICFWHVAIVSAAQRNLVPQRNRGNKKIKMLFAIASTTGKPRKKAWS